MRTLLVVLVALGMAGCAHAPKAFQWYDCGGAQCNLEDKLWQTKWDAARDEIDQFRHCQSLHVQQENESLGHFLDSLPRPIHDTCLILRERPQKSEPYQFTSNDHNVTIFGGTFVGDEAKQ